MSLAKKNNLSTGYNAYKDNEINTMSQGKLIVMLYDGAIKFLQTACDNMTPRKYELVHKSITRAQDIVTELMVSLNMDEGGKMANDLLSIYIYLKKRLLEANMKKDTQIVKEVIAHLHTLKNAWDEVSKKDLQSNTEFVPKSSGISIKG